MKLYIKQRVFTYKDKFDVKNAFNKKEYKVIGKIFALSKRFEIKNNDNLRVALVKKHIFSILPKYKIKLKGESYTLKRSFTFFKKKYKLSKLGWEVKGDFLNHDYDIKKGSKTIMRIKKHWFRWGDSYELDIPKNENVLLSLCIAVIIDAEIASDKELDNN